MVLLSHCTPSSACPPYAAAAPDHNRLTTLPPPPPCPLALPPARVLSQRTSTPPNLQHPQGQPAAWWPPLWSSYWQCRHHPSRAAQAATQQLPPLRQPHNQKQGEAQRQCLDWHRPPTTAAVHSREGAETVTQAHRLVPPAAAAQPHHQRQQHAATPAAAPAAAPRSQRTAAAARRARKRQAPKRLGRLCLPRRQHLTCWLTWGRTRPPPRVAVRRHQPPASYQQQAAIAPSSRNCPAQVQQQVLPAAYGSRTRAS